MFIVEIEKNVWLAPWTGNPGRTLVKENAKKYKTRHGADTALGIARKYRMFIHASISYTPDGTIGKRTRIGSI